MIEYKVYIAGHECVGKSALSIQFTHNEFMHEYNPCLEDNFIKNICVDKETCIINILDSRLLYEPPKRCKKYIGEMQGFALVYSVTSRVSFDELFNIKELIHRYKNMDKVPMVLIGNKIDLLKESEVSSKEGLERARLWGIPFFESSAKERENVDEPFFELIREIRRNNNPQYNDIRNTKHVKCQLL